MNMLWYIKVALIVDYIYGIITYNEMHIQKNTEVDSLEQQI